MAIVSRDRNNRKTVVGWVEDGPDGKTKRSKKLDTEAHAIIFKDLVEQNGERFPLYTTLREYGLEEYGYTINPGYILGLRAIVLREDMQPKEKIKLLRQALKDF